MAWPLKSPTGVLLTGNNWFHAGWICGILGLPPRDFKSFDYPVWDTDIDAYTDGYDMGRETENDIRDVFVRMIELGQIHVENITTPKPPASPGTEGA